MRVLSLQYYTIQLSQPPPPHCRTCGKRDGNATVAASEYLHSKHKMFKYTLL